jgi:hypothetical protein
MAEWNKNPRNAADPHEYAVTTSSSGVTTVSKRLRGGGRDNAAIQGQ